MASPARILALNVGTQTLGIAEFRPASTGGIVLNGYRLLQIEGEAVSDNLRGAQTQAAVVEALAALDVKPGAVHYAISAQSVFTRFVKLPAVDVEKVDQIIQFEAQQNVPFPIHEVVWDYQLVHGGDKDKMEVVLVAIKSDLLDEVNNSVEGGGLKTATVDVAPMALYNAFRYNYSDLGGCSLLVDIGARTTNLIFIEPKKVFSRSIPIGGNTISTAIAKEFNVAPAAAEERKKSDGYVGLGGAYAEPSDPEVARLSKIIRNTMTRLHAEIMRSISFYRAQQQGAQPVRVFLCGGSANLPYMREFFSEKLQMPIEYFNPLRNVAVTSAVDSEQVVKEAHLLGELVGLGLRGALDCPMELNLRPASVVQARKMEARQPFFLLAGICLVLSIAGWWLYFKRAAEIKGEVLQQVQGKVTELQGFEARFKEVRGQIASLEESSKPFLLATVEREYWTAVLEDIHERLPERFIWITEFEPTSGEGARATPVTPDTIGRAAATTARSQPGQPAERPKIDGIRLRGLYLDNPRQIQVLDAFVENLAKSPLFEKPTVPLRTQPTGAKWAYDFEIQVGLKTPLALP